MFMISILPLCRCALVNFQSFINGYFLSFLFLLLFFVFLIWFICGFCFVLFVLLISLNVIKKYLAWPNKSKRRTSLMVKAPPNHNNRKDYSLHRRNNVDNRRLSPNCTESINRGRKKEKEKKKVTGDQPQPSSLMRFDTYSSLRHQHIEPKC